MKAPAKRVFLNLLRWGIAVGGIVWVLTHIQLNDQVRVLGPNLELIETPVWNGANDADATFTVGDGSEVRPRADLWTLPNLKSVELADGAGGKRKWKLIAARPAEGSPQAAAELLVEHPDTKARQRVPASEVIGKDRPAITFPLVERGVKRMVWEADWVFLAAAVLVLPMSYLLTSYRWHVLLEAQQIHIGMARTFVINMVGAFYNSFMPGSTGGDLAKAYYASKHTTHRTRAVMTVIVDRVIGLLALLVLGGAMAAYQWDVPECRNVAIGAGAIIAVTVTGLVVFYVPVVRRLTGFDWFLRKLPMQERIRKVVEALDTYGRHPWAAAWAFACSFPVHATSIVSATLAGLAFHLPLDLPYYWVVIPVTALAGAVPISPQGAGVMEFFAVQLTIHRGVTVAQAVALVMCIRLTGIFWNLLAGLFVVKGGYHAPTEAEQHELDVDEPEEGEEGVAVNGDAKAKDVVAGVPTVERA